VEIAASAAPLQGIAPLAVVAVEPPREPGGQLIGRVARRLAGATTTRIRAERARVALRRLGYPHTEVVPWDVGQRARLAGLAAPARSRAERLPSRALAIGRRATDGMTVLEAVVVDASRQRGTAHELEWVWYRAGILIGAADGGILRVAIGPARNQVVNPADTLELLRAADPPPAVGGRLPWVLARGRTGLADWSLERRMPGSRPPRALTQSVAEDCLDFLVGLRRTAEDAPHGRSCEELAETAAAVCSPESASNLRRFAGELDRRLSGLPRAFGHGDFFAGNLVVHEGRLAGVLDWDAAGPGRLPLVDLLHLQLTRTGYGPDHAWGAALVEYLLPSVVGDRDELIRRYCDEVGLARDRGVLEALVAAYWLGYVAYQLETHPGRLSEPLWIQGNVEDVLRELRSLSRQR
jgi:hypothetical protein